MSLPLTFFVLLPSAIPGQMNSPSTAPDENISLVTVVRKDGVVVSVSRPHRDKVQLTIKGANGDETFQIDRMTMVYRLTERNVHIFQRQDKLQQIVDDVTLLRRQLRNLDSKALDARADRWVRITGRADYEQYRLSFRPVGPGVVANESYNANPGYLNVRSGGNALKEKKLEEALLEFHQAEEQRRNRYGPRTWPRRDMKVMVVADQGSDTTYAVLVTGEPPPNKPERVQPTKEEEAARKLKLAKMLLNDARTQQGPGRADLFERANARLEDIVTNYGGTKAAQEAKSLIDSSIGR